MDDLKLVIVPDPTLKAKSLRVENHKPEEYDKAVALGQKMLLFMEASKGVGLAAPQIGINTRVFVASSTGRAIDGKIYINPVFMDADGYETGKEGCLSIPLTHLPIQRRKKATISALLSDRELFFQEDDGLLARIWQHEMDHLDGVLITDRFTEQNPNGWKDVIADALDR